MALSRVVSEIFNVEKYRDLEIRVKGQSRSWNVVPFDRPGIYGFILVFFSNFVLKRRRFEIFDFKKCRDLQNWVRGP